MIPTSSNNQKRENYPTDGGQSIVAIEVKVRNMGHIAIVVDGIGTHVQHGLPECHQSGSKYSQPRISAIL
jgi:hypothetical protein